ncbi:X2-like carbohydrate binding domain-containing protein [Ruminiclostridium cellobioparum]|uniref:F5/8 type C domain-containing protein n=1 Tax=Ruminiclostridium cellobioparum subsp. termitidis CT1112 TaxID=1195236 RepID=S0FPS8_RUMCE|nr:X2-like carbohydrate binding domain-containing protein [Ruminiclostridium cellobioparum]EMS73852.1 F5/8 type C domain/Domain of unknown function [Ruminiclostridium cellobioparum subsp. termitidis CT1112]
MRRKLALFTAISMFFTCLFSVGVINPVNADTQQSFYVSPTGNDSDSGTSGEPFKTVARAKEAVSEINSSMTGDIYVYLENGTYTLNDTLNFGSSDSGTNGHNIIYTAAPGANPVISGGADVSNGWELYDNEKNIYRRTGVDWDFRQLYIDDDRGIRAREPNLADQVTGGPYFRAANGSYPYQIRPSDISTTSMSAITLNGTAEMVVVQSWSQVRGRVGSFNTTTGAIDFKYPESGFSYNHHSQGDSPYFLENDLSLLDAEGEWFLDTAQDTLYYKPVSGQTMNSTQIIAPRLETLVNFRGNSKENKVHNIVFSGITFKYSNWLAPSSYGYVDVQAGFRYQTVTGGDNSEIRNTARYTAPAGMLQLKNTSSITIENNTFQYSGSWGIIGYEATDHTLIDWNSFIRNAGGGVAMGIVGDLWDDTEGREPSYTVPDGQSLYDTITNNTIDTVALDYKDMVGIGAMLPQNMTIANNEISDLPYTGITIGWNWSDVDHGMTNNQVYQNYVHDSVRLLQDGGGIYTLGRMDGRSNFYHNYIKNMRVGPWAAWNHIMGIYMDNGSSYKMAERNVIENTEGVFSAANSPNHDNIIRYNYYNIDKFDGISGSNITYGNIKVSGTDWPQEARDIIAAAGPGKAELPTPAEPVNLALAKAVTASTEGVREYHPAKFAVDGDASTRWACVEGNTDWQWLEIDLGGEYSIGSINTLFELDFGEYNYKIDYALGDKVWNSYVDKSGEKTTQRSNTDIKEVTARYIRITMKGGWGSSINEINIYPGSGGNIPEANSLILKTEAKFDKNPTRQQNIEVKMALNGGTLNAVKNGAEILTEGRDYLLYWDRVIFLKEYLNTLPDGENNLTFDFATGDDPVLKVEVTGDDGSVNISLNKPITSSSRSFAPQLAVDGKTTTRWAQQEGQWNLDGWLCVDLQGVYDVSSVNTMFELTSGYKYKIEYSLDGKAWQTYVDKYGEKTQQQIIDDKKPVTARYMKITLFYEMGPSIYELSVFGAPAGQNSSIGTTKASFDKEPANQSDIPVSMDLKGNTLTGIKNGTLYLNPEDYTVDGNSVTISKSYLASLGQGKTSLDFEFSAGKNSSLEIDVTEVNGEINIALGKPVEATSQSFSPQYLTDGNETTRWAQQTGMNQPQSLKVDLGDVYTITHTSTMFEMDSGYKYKIEYSTDGNSWSVYADKTGSFTTKKTNDDQKTAAARYMRLSIPQPTSGVGIYEFKAFAVNDRGISNSSISPTSIVFDRNTAAQTDAVIDMTLNGNTLTAIKNGEQVLKADTDYRAGDGKVTISKSYLASLDKGTVNLTFQFSKGQDCILKVNVIDTTPEDKAMFTIAPVGEGLSKVGGIQAAVKVSPADKAYPGPVWVLFQLMDGTTPKGIVAIKQNIDSAKEITAFFNVNPAGNSYRVKVFVLDQWNSDTSIPESLAEALTLNQ